MSAPPASPPPPVGESLLQALMGLAKELPALVSDRLELLALELHRARNAMVQIVMLVVAAAILGVTAWLALWCGVAAWLVSLGLAWPLSLLAVLALNLIAAWVAIARVRSLVPRLGLPATRRHLSFSLKPQPSAGSPTAPHHDPVSPVPANGAAPTAR